MRRAAIQSDAMLWLAAAALAGVGVVSLLCLCFVPIDASSSPVSVADVQQSADAKNRQAALREQLEQEADRPLRQSLDDSPTATAEALTPATPQPPLPSVLGTIVEPGRSLALIQSGNSVAFKQVGDVVAGEKIVAIDAAGIRIDRQGQTIAVQIKPTRGAKETGT